MPERRILRRRDLIIGGAMATAGALVGVDRLRKTGDVPETITTGTDGSAPEPTPLNPATQGEGAETATSAEASSNEPIETETPEREKNYDHLVKAVEIAFPGIHEWPEGFGAREFYDTIQPGDYFYRIDRDVRGGPTFQVEQLKRRGSPEYAEDVLAVDVQVDEDGKQTYHFESGHGRNPDQEFLSGLTDEELERALDERFRLFGIEEGQFLEDDDIEEEALAAAMEKYRKFYEGMEALNAPIPGAKNDGSNEDNIRSVQIFIQRRREFIQYCDALDAATGQPNFFLDPWTRKKMNDEIRNYEQILEHLRKPSSSE